MGMFSFECKGCEQELIQDEEVRLNGCNGIYDGHGCAGDYDFSGDYSEPVAWHQKCYGEATDAEKLDETPSQYARNQGFGFPQADCLPENTWGEYVEPTRVKYAEIRKADIQEYLNGLFAEDEAKGDKGYWFFRDPFKKTGHFTLADIADRDFDLMRAEFGDRFAHEQLDEDDRKGRDGEFWSDFDPGDHYFAMRDRFQGRHGIVSEIAHVVLSFARKRLR